MSAIMNGASTSRKHQPVASNIVHFAKEPTKMNLADILTNKLMNKPKQEGLLDRFIY